jgi:hypothetical protein
MHLCERCVPAARMNVRFWAVSGPAFAGTASAIIASARSPIRRIDLIGFASFLLQRSGVKFTENAEKGRLSNNDNSRRTS